MRRKQHGDVIFVKVKNLPEDAREISAKKGYIIEKGEGLHTHTLAAEKDVKLYQTSNGTLYMQVFKKTDVLDHEEHGLQTYEPGIYRKMIELEYDAETNETRRTKD